MTGGLGGPGSGGATLRRGLLLGAFVLGFGAQPSVAVASPAESKDATAWFEEGAEAYARENYEEAAAAFAKSYALEPSTDVLFAWAQTERLGGNCEEATRLYDRFLDSDPPEQQREAATQLKGECVPRDDASQSAEDEDPTEASAESPRELAPVAFEVDEHDGGEPAPKTGLILMGTGAGVSAVGLGLMIGGGVLDRRAANAGSYDELERLRDPNTGRAKGAVPLYAAGGVLAAAGVGVLVAGVLRHKKDRREMSRLPTASPSFGREFVGISLQWRR